MSQIFAKKGVAIGVAVIVIITAIYFFMNIQEQKRASRLLDLKKRADLLHRTEPEKAIPLHEEAARLAKDPLEKGRILISLYAEYAASGDAQKKRDAIVGLKKLAEDPFFTLPARAGAYMNIADIYYGNVDKDFARTVIFAADTFRPLLDESHEDIPAAIKKIYERSVGLFPYSKAYLRIGLWYGGQLLHNQTLSAEEKKIYLEELDKNVRAADALFQRDTAQLEITQQVAMAVIRARISAINTILGRGDRAHTEELYRAAITLADSRPGDAFLPHLEFITRVDYATFLYRSSGKKEATTIQALFKDIQRFATDQSYGAKLSRQFLVNQNKPHAGEHAAVRHWQDKEDLLAIASVSSEFKSLLKAVGWVF